MTTTIKPEVFIPSSANNPEEYVHASRENGRGYHLEALTIPYGPDATQLSFIQVDMPDGTSAYFRPDGTAGPFGGGYSWAVPKYVLKEVAALILEVWPPAEEETEEEVTV